MNALMKLKLVASKPKSNINPVITRRNKLAERIAEQIALAAAKKNGQVYAPKKLKTVKDAETGEKRSVETTKRVKEWFWNADNGKLNVSIRYGSKVIELAKGKNAVEVANADELVQVLGVIKDSVLAGELDEAINAASDKLRSGFKK